MLVLERSFELWSYMVCEAFFADFVTSEGDRCAGLTLQAEVALEVVCHDGDDFSGWRDSVVDDLAMPLDEHAMALMMTRG